MKKQDTAPVKPAKLPKFAKKTYTAKAWKKKIIGKIFLPQDKAFLEEIFSQQADGRYAIKAEVNKKEKERLKKLGKAIKKNKGMLRTGRLAVPVIVLGAAILFTVLFKDKLLTNAMEDGLEYIFQAKTDVLGLDFNPLSGAVNINSIIVADQNQPMRNLFVLDEIWMKISLTALINRSFTIEEMRLGNMAYGTARQESGALQGSELAADGGDQQASGQSQSIFKLPSLDPADAKEIVASSIDKLQVTQDIKQATELAKTSTEKWGGTVEEAQEQISDFSGTMRQLSAINPSALNNPQEIRDAIQVVQRGQQGLGELADSSGGGLSQARNDLSAARQAVRGATSGMDQDIARLQQGIKSAADNPEDLLMQAAAMLLSDSVNARIQDARTAYVRLQRLSQLRNKQGSEDSKDKPRRMGVDISFSDDVFPAFYLKLANAAFTHEASHQALLQELSSDFSLTGQAALADYTQERNGQKAMQVRVDMPLHDEEQVPIQLNVAGNGMPIQVEKVLPMFGNMQLAGAADMQWKAYVTDAQTMTIEGSIAMQKPALQLEAGMLSDMVAAAAAQAGSLSADLVIDVQQGVISSIKGSTNLDSIIADQIKQELDRRLAAMRQAIETELKAYVDSQMAELSDYSGKTESLFQETRQAQNQISDWQEEADAKKQALENRLDQLSNQVKTEVQDKATDAVQEGANRVLGGRRLPSF